MSYAIETTIVFCIGIALIQLHGEKEAMTCVGTDGMGYMHGVLLSLIKRTKMKQLHLGVSTYVRKTPCVH